MISFTLHFQQHPIKSFVFCYMVLFITFLFYILDINNKSL